MVVGFPPVVNRKIDNLYRKMAEILNILNKMLLVAPPFRINHNTFL